jgi:hypothetical protein
MLSNWNHLPLYIASDSGLFHVHQTKHTKMAALNKHKGYDECFHGFWSNALFSDIVHLLHFGAKLSLLYEIIVMPESYYNYS